jgi:pilus assembly protein CpaF
MNGTDPRIPRGGTSSEELAAHIRSRWGARAERRLGLSPNAPTAWDPETGSTAVSQPGILAGQVGAATVATGHVLGVHDLRVAVTAVRDHLWGLGALRPLAEDPEVTDILVNGGGQVWVDRGGGLRPVSVDLGGEDQIRALAVRLASSAGRRLDESRPWADARLEDGIRMHAVVPPVAPEGTHLSLRFFREPGVDLVSLVQRGSLPADWRAVLEALIRLRAAFLVTGGTGVGKTTLLSSLLSLVPRQHRVVLVEDVGELRPRHPHVIRLEARHANVEGRGHVGLDELVRLALRMRPDRLVVGECRGPEVRELLTALNTGHEGGCGTLHANSPAEVPARLVALGALAGMSPEAVRAQAIAALDVVIHLARTGDGLRHVAEIAVVRSAGDGECHVVPALTRGGDGVPVPGPGWHALAERLDLVEVDSALRRGDR